MREPLYRILSRLLDARKNCIKSGNEKWIAIHTRTLHKLEDHLPSGSGIDNGTLIDVEHSQTEQIELFTSFHHMNDQGFYTNWTKHRIIVKPSLLHGITLRITGPNPGNIKDHLHDLYYLDLMTEYDTDTALSALDSVADQLRNDSKKPD